MKEVNKGIKGITMVVLVVTIIVLLILSAVVINLTVGQNGLFSRSKQATDEHIKQEATEAMNLKISGIQIQSYTEKMELPNLQYLANKLCEDEEMEYVLLESKKEASLAKIDVTDKNSIFTKIKRYPYEFEIDSELKLASIDGIKIASSEGKVPDGYIKPEGTIEIKENGEHDVASYVTAKVDVPIPDNYMEKPTQENVKITQKARDIDVTNYKSIDTTGLYTQSELNNVTGEGKYWAKGTTNMTNGNAEINIGFVPSRTTIEMKYTSGIICVLAINGTTNATIYNMGSNNGVNVPWFSNSNITNMADHLSYSNGKFKIVNWGKESTAGLTNASISWYAVK